MQKTVLGAIAALVLLATTAASAQQLTIQGEVAPQTQIQAGNPLLTLQSRSKVLLTPSELASQLPPCQGDAGSGGVQGMVPAPPAGSAAQNWYLGADCVWKALPSGGGGGGSGGEHWFVDANNRPTPKNVLVQQNVADGSGVVNVDALYPGVIPANAKSLILTIETGYVVLPPNGNGSVSMRVFPAGYTYPSNYIDRCKTGQVLPNYTSVGFPNQDCRMPINATHRTFSWVRESTDAANLSKMSIIDMWGYVD